MTNVSRVFTSACAVLLLTGSLLGAQAALRSTNDGVFTAAQVDTGKTTFKAKCSDCHETSYFEEALLDQWTGKPLSALYEMLVSNMPANKPGSLSDQEYADVMSLLLQLNGVQPGSTVLVGGKEAMATIRFDRPTGANVP